MTKAEIKALENYPVTDGKVWTSAFGTFEFDQNYGERLAFQKGYEQAEKDLTLTLEDIERLHTFLYAVKNNKSGCFTFTRLSEEQYQEVLRRFNESRK